jgi:two-component system sensor histidine kinase YesM
MKKTSSLRFKIALYSLSITFSILAVTIGLSYRAVQSFLIHNLIEATHYRLRIAMDSIDGNMHRIGAMADWASLNHEIMNFVLEPPENAGAKRLDAIIAHRSLRDSMYAGGYDKYIDKILIGDLAGESIQVGLVNGHADDYAVCRAWFQANDFDRSGALGDHTVEAPFAYSPAASAIPLLRRIYDYEATRVIGFAAFAVNDQVITAPLKQYDLDADTSLFVLMGGQVYDASDRRTLVPLAAPEAYLAAVAGRAADAVSIEIELGGRRRVLALAEGDSTGWIIAQTLPTIQFTRQNRVFGALLALVAIGMLAMVFLILIAVDGTVNQPIGRINRRVDLIASGDFSADPGIESDNELGNIGKAVNRMSKKIEELIAQRLSDEKAKKSLEFRMLQSQINPHFLYNTLNAIKWTATIQKAAGIAEMASSLATLLRHAARGTEELVPLSVELELVREYCTIQNYRSAGLFELSVDVGDPELDRALLMKFTLQPLVENAIMHGIEPGGRGGTIRIRAGRVEADRLLITVGDDGIGIAPDRLASILEPSETDGKAFNHIGLANVDQRIRLRFGAAFGLSVASRAGEGTQVSVLLPLIVGAEGQAEGQADV